ncbi:MAG TPA: aspartate--tRNA ligase [Saprospiraceae bacterium]|nr:aspartate--tRNA ligase [Saprospiraceae bacterium]
MYRTVTCGDLRITHVSQSVTLAGWVQSSRNLGGMTFIDLRDRYGITQLVFNLEDNEELCLAARKLGREYVIQIKGTVRERSAKNANRPTGDVEIQVTELVVLNASSVPPFTIEDESDGGEELRMKYRYLDIRRNPVKEKLLFRHQIALETRKYLSELQFTEIETPYLIKSTPEGARDFVVPSRMNQGQFYALPQSPQTFKQILMVAGMDRYFQIVRCFRDEDLRADRQPEFTQIDCEMAFVEEEDILITFEGLMKHLFKTILQIELPDFPRMSYDEALRDYGSDKPDLRFDMKIQHLNDSLKDKGFAVFDNAELVAGIVCKGIGESYSNKDINDLTDWVKRPQIGAKGLVYIKYNQDGSLKSSVGKFFTDEQLKELAQKVGAEAGDLLLILAGTHDATLKQCGELRLEMARRMNLMKPGEFKAFWVLDFPLLEWDEESQRFFAMHHPFTSPLPQDMHKLNSSDKDTLKSIRAAAYDMVINGAEVGGGSIRIHDRALQAQNFKLLGFTEEEAEAQFGFLLGAFEYGAPPHGGIAFGLDRVCAIMQGSTSIRDYIAFPKNNQGRDMMIDAPSALELKQLNELGVSVMQK